MVLEIKWLGVDFGQCLMNPGGLRNRLMVGDVMKDMGKPEEIPERVNRYRRMKEKYGHYGRIKEGHLPELLQFVFDGEAEAGDLFMQNEAKFLLVPEGVAETLAWLREQGISLDLVAEMKKTLGAVKATFAIRFLQSRELLQYFDYLYSPQGKFGLKDDSADSTCKDKDKESGTLYDYIIEDLARRSIKVNECAIMGDKLTTDIIPPRKRGFHTIQFAGVSDGGSSEFAEYKVNSYLELKDFVRGIK